MSTPYYDQQLDKGAAKKLLKSLDAEHLPGRSKPGIVVYAVRGGGEAMVEAGPGEKVRVRLYKGACAC